MKSKMEIEEKLQPIAMNVTEKLEDLSHWESMLVLEMVKQSLNAIWLAESSKKGAFRD